MTSGRVFSLTGVHSRFAGIYGSFVSFGGVPRSPSSFTSFSSSSGCEDGIAKTSNESIVLGFEMIAEDDGFVALPRILPFFERRDGEFVDLRDRMADLFGRFSFVDDGGLTFFVSDDVSRSSVRSMSLTLVKRLAREGVIGRAVAVVAMVGDDVVRIEEVSSMFRD